jgi:hypothetical protein
MHSNTFDLFLGTIYTHILVFQTPNDWAIRTAWVDGVPRLSDLRPSQFAVMPVYVPLRDSTPNSIELFKYNGRLFVNGVMVASCDSSHGHGIFVFQVERVDDDAVKPMFVFDIADMTYCQIVTDKKHDDEKHDEQSDDEKHDEKHDEQSDDESNPPTPGDSASGGGSANWASGGGASRSASGAGH